MYLSSVKISCDIYSTVISAAVDLYLRQSRIGVIAVPTIAERNMFALPSRFVL